MPRPKTISSRQYETVEGIAVVLEFSNRAHNVEIIPDDGDIAVASAYSVLALWEWLARWAVEFRRRNPGWKVNGRTDDAEADPLAAYPAEGR